MGFAHTIRVRYGEVDRQGVVFNAHWLAYFDDAMTRFFAWLGFPAEAWETAFDARLVKAVLQWHAGVGFDDEVTVAVRPARLGNASFDLHFMARVDGQEAVEATITYVSVEPLTDRSRPIPRDVRARLEQAAQD